MVARADSRFHFCSITRQKVLEFVSPGDRIGAVTGRGPYLRSRRLTSSAAFVRASIIEGAVTHTVASSKLALYNAMIMIACQVSFIRTQSHCPQKAWCNANGKIL